MQSRISIKQIAIGILIGVSISIVANTTAEIQTIAITGYGFGKGMQTGVYLGRVMSGQSASMTCEALKPTNDLYTGDMEGATFTMKQTAQNTVKVIRQTTLIRLGIADCEFDE